VLTSDPAVGLLWVAAILRLFRGRQRPHAASLQSITVALFAIALAGTVDIAPVSEALGRWVHWPNIGSALKNVGIVVAAVANQVMLLHLDRGSALTRRSITRRWRIAGVVSAVSLALFFAGGRYPQNPSFVLATAGEPWVSDSRLVVTVYAAYVLTAVTILCRRQITWTPLGRGLGVLGSGAALMVAYSVLRVVYLGGHSVGIDVPDWVYAAGSDTSALGLALVALGTLLPSLEQAWRSRRDLRHLHDLWADTTGQAPAAASGGPKSGDATIQAAHRVVQIQDALYLLTLKRSENGTSDLLGTPAERAARIARWVRDLDDHEIGPRDLATPPGMSDHAWIGLIAERHRQPTGTLRKVSR